MSGCDNAKKAKATFYVTQSRKGAKKSNKADLFWGDRQKTAKWFRFSSGLKLCVFAVLREVTVLTENDISKEIVDASYKVHTVLGPGLLESVYEAVLAYELEKRGLRVVRQLALPVMYETVQLDEGFRVDMMVEDKVIIELKSVEVLASVHKKQLLTYLRLSGCKLGLLINFGTALIKDGIVRIANGMET